MYRVKRFYDAGKDIGLPHKTKSAIINLRQ